MNAGNSKTKKPQTLRNLSVCYMRKNIRQQYKKSKLSILPLNRNDEFALLGDSYSVRDTQDCI